MRNLRIRETVEPEKLKEFLLGLSKDSLYTFNHFGDIRRSNVDDIVSNELARKDKLKFFASINNEVVTYGFLTLFDKPTKKHNCILGIVVGDRWQGRGLGMAVCKHMIKGAWRAGLEKVWLNVHSDNPRAIHLYKSLGFEIEGVFMADEIVKDGARHIVSMAIFRNMRYGKKKRLKIWDNIED